MRVEGSDQGGRWPVGLWFALVGMSAGTVASFAAVGWTFTSGLYDDEPAVALPPNVEPGTVVIEADESAATSGEDPPGPVPTGPETEPIAGPGTVEPRSEPVREDPVLEPVAPPPPAEREEERGEEHAEVEDPPRLVPIEESGPECGETPGEDLVPVPPAEDGVPDEDEMPAPPPEDEVPDEDETPALPPEDGGEHPRHGWHGDWDWSHEDHWSDSEQPGDLTPEDLIELPLPE